MAKKILWIFGYTENSGYARNSREWIKGLNAAGMETRFLVHEGAKDYPDMPEMKPFESYVGYEYDLVIHNVIPPCFDRKADYFPRETKHILMTVAETDSVSESWVNKCNEADEVWTMSYFSKMAFVHSGVSVPVEITLMPIDIERIRNSKSDSFRFHKDPGAFVFFANSEWTPRKGWDILLEAYFHAFQNDPNVSLIIKTCCFSGVDNFNSMRNMIEMFKYEKKSQARVFLIADIIPAEDVWFLYKSADCYVLPTRGEGCGIPYLEALACGVPVIAPDRGGQVDYILPGTGQLIKSQLKPACRFPHNPNYNESMLWIQTDINELVKSMIDHRYNSVRYQDKSGFANFDATFGHGGTEVMKTIQRIEAL